MGVAATMFLSCGTDRMVWAMVSNVLHAGEMCCMFIRQCHSHVGNALFTAALRQVPLSGGQVHDVTRWQTMTSPWRQRRSWEGSGKRRAPHQNLSALPLGQGCHHCHLFQQPYYCWIQRSWAHRSPCKDSTSVDLNDVGLIVVLKFDR